MASDFKCPNCGEVMTCLINGIRIQSGVYDKWTCEYCSHILVLDWRDS